MGDHLHPQYGWGSKSRGAFLSARGEVCHCTIKQCKEDPFFGYKQNHYPSFKVMFPGRQPN